MKKGISRAITNEIKRFSDRDISTGRYRTDFMRDRDRILYSKPFRRLSRKTQIFLPASDDHVRTRLTHSLEVLQISAVSAQIIGLDRDLTEAIALGHDIGHTPFGHTGERVLNLFMTNCDPLGGLSIKLEKKDTGFKHNLQGLRQVIDLTDLYDDIRGLNLTNFTLWGIQNHTGMVWKKCNFRYENPDGDFCCNYPQANKLNKCIVSGSELFLENKFYDRYDKFILQKESNYKAWSFEGLLVAMADEIAQRHHDIEDGLIAEVIQKDEIIELIRELLFPYFNKDDKNLFSTMEKKEDGIFIQKISKLVVGCLNRNLITNTRENFKSFYKEFSIKTRKDFETIYPGLTLEHNFTGRNGKMGIGEIISYPPGLKKDEKILKSELGKRVLNSYQVQRMDGKARFVIRQLAKAYLTNPQQLPDHMINRLICLCHPEKDEATNIPISEKRAWLNDVYLSSQNNFIKRVLLRLICDFIASMTDDFALMEHAKLYSTSETFNLRHY